MTSIGRRFNRPKREQYLDHLKAGMMRGAAAYVLGFKRHEIDGYISEHPDFELEVRDAEETATEHVHEALWQAAASGNVAAAKLWLGIRSQAHRRIPADPGGTSPAPSPTDPDDVAEVAALMQELDP